MVDVNMLQEKHMNLFQEYVNIWEDWVEDMDNQILTSKLSSIKSKIENISVGVQFTTILQKIEHENSGIIVPNMAAQQNIPSNVIKM